MPIPIKCFFLKGTDVAVEVLEHPFFAKVESDRKSINSKLQKLPTIWSHQKFDYICNAQAVNSVLLEKKDQGGLKRVNVSNGNSASRILDRGGLILKSPRLISLPKKTFHRGTVCGGHPWEEISGM